MKGLAKEHICMTRGHRHQCGDGKGGRRLGVGGKAGEMQDSNSVNDKNKKVAKM